MSTQNTDACSESSLASFSVVTARGTDLAARSADSAARGADSANSPLALQRRWPLRHYLSAITEFITGESSTETCCDEASASLNDDITMHNKLKEQELNHFRIKMPTSPAANPPTTTLADDGCTLMSMSEIISSVGFSGSFITSSSRTERTWGGR